MEWQQELRDRLDTVPGGAERLIRAISVELAFTLAVTEAVEHL